MQFTHNGLASRRNFRKSPFYSRNSPRTCNISAFLRHAKGQIVRIKPSDLQGKKQKCAEAVSFKDILILGRFELSHGLTNRSQGLFIALRDTYEQRKNYLTRHLADQIQRRKSRDEPYQ